MNSSFDFSIIKSLRKRRNLTLEKLAESSGLTYSTVTGIESQKTNPSLKTLDSIAAALHISTSTLVALAEKRRVQIREAKSLDPEKEKGPLIGLDKCKVAQYDKGKMFRVTAKKGEVIQVMGLHDDCNEFCYVIRGLVHLRIENQAYELQQDKTILFDGILDHCYTAIEDCDFITVHMPKDNQIIESLLRPNRISQIENTENTNKTHELN
jgi:transcriptional regulator with XRE-family HTH domain